MDWINDRMNDLTNLGSGGWLAIAAWAALLFGIVVLVSSQPADQEESRSSRPSRSGRR